MKRTLTRSILGVLLASFSVSAIQAGGLSGAIFTTNASGTIVNANTQYASKCDVYLDGGPGPNAPAKAAGLPAGDYYFQVTDPNGGTLLSTDPVSSRRFTVSNGVITAFIGVGHPTGIDSDHPELFAITIRLANTSCPTDFKDTPNNGGVYKVWVTPVGDFVGDPALVDNACGNGCYHGFVPSKSKTDNFKAASAPPVTTTFCLSLYKEMPGGLRVSAWQFDVTDPVGGHNIYNATDIGFTQCGFPTGQYSVTEVMQPNWSLVSVNVNGVDIPFPSTTYTFTQTTGSAVAITFVNNPPPF